MIFVKVPADRIAVVIGPHGQTRKTLAERSGLPIEVDTNNNEVAIDDKVQGADPVMILKIRDVVKALGRGFSPEHAMLLFSDDFYLELLDIHDYVGKDKSHLRRVTARLIG